MDSLLGHPDRFLWDPLLFISEVSKQAVCVSCCCEEGGGGAGRCGAASTPGALASVRSRRTEGGLGQIFLRAASQKAIWIRPLALQGKTMKSKGRAPESSVHAHS